MIRLPVWCVQCKNRNFGCSAGIYIFNGMSKVSEIFTQNFYTNCLFCPNFLEFLELHKYSKCSDCYRLSCLRQILFLMHCFASFDETIDFIGGISHKEVII